MIDSNYFILTKLIMIVAVICIAIMIITIIIRAKDITKKYKGDHMASGMFLGISFGMLIGMLFDNSGNGMFLGMSFGEIIGMTIGVLIPKK